MPPEMSLNSSTPVSMMTEAQLQAAVVELARVLGFRTYHPFDSRRSSPGFLDLTLVKGSRLIFAELKRASGRLMPEQVEWMRALAGTAAETYLWRPDDWQTGRIETTLRGVA